MDADEVVARLGLTPHPEGGHYRETWRDQPPGGGRGAGTAIYFFLGAGEMSGWHRVDATEIWHYYAGGPLELSISLDGETYLPMVLGADVRKGERPQAIVPAGCWQSARNLRQGTLVGCTVSPAFEFAGFELAGPDQAPSRLGPLAGPAWLAEHRGEVVVCDVRWYLDGRSGLSAYRAGHLPGAVFVDLDRYLAGPPSPAAGRHPLPDPVVFAAGMTEAGVGDGDIVIAYDDQGGMAAGRLVWLLRVLGHQAALLDGGLGAWTGPLETGSAGPLEEGTPGGTAAAATAAPRAAPPRRRTAAAFTPRPWPADALAGADEVMDVPVLVDARAPERYRGEVEPIDPKPGHIPGAVNIPFAGNLAAPGGPFLGALELRRRYEAAGVRRGADVVVYCGSGVSACHDLLAIEAAGLGRGRLYPGSWSQWCADPARPVATGDDPSRPA